MAKQLATSVSVRHPETNRFHTFNPGDDVPDWAVDRITNPAAWAEEGEAEADEVPAPSPVQANSLVISSQTVANLEQMSINELREYASENDINLHGASRKDEIVDHIKEHEANQ